MRSMVWLAALAGMALLAGEGPAAAQAARFDPALTAVTPLLTEVQFRGGHGIRPHGGFRRGGLRHGGGFGHRGAFRHRGGFGRIGGFGRHRLGRPYGFHRGLSYRHGYGYGHRRGIGAGVAGFAAGAVLGSSLAHGYGGPGYAYNTAPATGVGNAEASCAQRFRSYNPSTGTYTGYDGRQHRCP